MTKVMTVLGPIRPEELGFTDMHEHVMMDGGWVLRKRYKSQLQSGDDRYTVDDPVTLSNIGLIKRNFMTNWDGLSFDDEGMILGEVQDYQKSGGKSILELSVPGIRTKVPTIKKIAEKTGAHIVISTGLYTGDSWPDKYLAMGEKEIHDYMLNEVENGVEDTGIFPGHLKIAIETMTNKEETALRAAAHVANETGMSLTVHCADGRQVVEVLKSEGMDVSRAVIAHAASAFAIRDMKLMITHPELYTLRLDYLRELLGTGVNICLEFTPGNVESEGVGRVVIPDWIRLAGVVKLLDEGYASQIVFGTDTCAKVMTRRYGGEGYCRLTRFAIPTLRNCGVSDYQIRMITEKNPARILAY